MFAITCGLNHSAVMRLKNSRQRLPPKYTKLLEELTQVIVPDRNFSRYRNLISNASVSHTCYYVPNYSVPSSIYSWSIGHILEHEFFCLGCLGSQGSKEKKKVDWRNSEKLLRVVFSTFGGQNLEKNTL